MEKAHYNGRKYFAIFTSFSTLFLIFAGSMVTSTESGLAVPDWPLSYGMVFPPMVAGVFYEHGHRMVASAVGFFTLVLACWLGFTEQRKWVRRVGFLALGAVILQGLLGGLTVLFMLPTPISVCHATLAQLFFLLTILVAYSQTQSWKKRVANTESHSNLWKYALFTVLIILVQLIIGAWMRHTKAGLAIYDFPLAAGYIVPPFNAEMLKKINDWHFYNNDLNSFSMAQVAIHFAHRVGAVVVLLSILWLNYKTWSMHRKNKPILWLITVIDAVLILQITLGAFTVLTMKSVYITSFHVVTGAAFLGLNFLLLLRTFPNYSSFQKPENTSLPEVVGAS